jgi:NADPH:quinone reductase-like Zn-dependent oxidoreductase
MCFETVKRSCIAIGSVLLLGFVGASTQAAENMRAAVLKGDSLALSSVPKPEPAAGQVRIKVHAASINPVDWRNGARIPGRDVAGVIDALGSAVSQWKVGDPVIAILSGGYAEFAIAGADAVARKPTDISFEEAAGLPVVGETAWRAIVTVADVKPGQRVLIHGGAGGVGSAAVQVAHARGAHVIATASTRNHDFLRSIGADEVIDYNTTRFEETVQPVDMVLNTVDPQTGARSIGIIKRGGILVSIVGEPDAKQCAEAQIRCAITGQSTGAMLKEVTALVEAGKYRAPVDQVFPLAQADQAWQLGRQRHTRGKLILKVSE